MPISFQKSPRPTLGVEVEIQLIDQKTKDLTPGALPILQEASKYPQLRAKSEFSQAMVEINTNICETVAQVGDDLKKQIELLRNIARAQGVEIAVSGTHPFQAWWERTIYPSERYQRILEKYQWLARRLTIFGLHVHVGVQDGDRAIALINALINYIPHLLALSASSPFWGGRDTGLSSARPAIFESLPMGGLPYFFVDWKEFQKYFDTMVSTNAIHSIHDIYWDIRPHFNFGTVEVRICDGLSTLRETLALVALIQCLVVWLDNQYEKGTRSRQIHMPRYWVAPENKWQAIRYGLDGDVIVQEGNERRLLKEEVIRLRQELIPIAQSLKCEKELSFVEDILKNGTSTVRQRRVFTEKQSLVAVVENLIEEFKQ